MADRGPRDEYTARLSARQSELARRLESHVWLGNVRMGLFLALLGMAVAAFGRGLFSAWWLLMPVALLVAIGQVMERLEATITRLQRGVEFYERGLNRLEGRWAGQHGQGVTGERFRDEHHLYAVDLDILGDASLFERLCLARTERGEATLAAWLLSPSSPDVVADRQRAVKELMPRLDLREDVALAGPTGAASTHSAGTLALWGEAPVHLLPSMGRLLGWALSMAGLLAVAAAVAYVGATAGFIVLPEPTVILLGRFALTTAVICFSSDWVFGRRTAPIIAAVFAAEQQLALLSGVMARIEAEPFDAPSLTALRNALLDGPRRASAEIAKLGGYVQLLHWRRNEIVRLLGPLVLWDLHVSNAIERWRSTSGSRVRGWLDAVGTMEALSSLACYGYERPGDVFPEFTTESPLFDAEDLKHPLLPDNRVVPNDVHLGGDLRVLVVSGSNMSGKSTLLRSIGVNAVLAQAGAPVAASRLRLSPLQIGASIRVQDSLREGTSRFYAEISRLSAVMTMAGGSTAALFLIDEFLHGTNSHDRLIGAEAVVRGLVHRGAIGLITTHDLALTRIVTDLAPRAANVHFQDYLEKGQMRFDYHLREGVVQHSNALELMRSVGLDV